MDQFEHLDVSFHLCLSGTAKCSSAAIQKGVLYYTFYNETNSDASDDYSEIAVSISVGTSLSFFFSHNLKAEDVLHLYIYYNNHIMLTKEEQQTFIEEIQHLEELQNCRDNSVMSQILLQQRINALKQNLFIKYNYLLKTRGAASKIDSDPNYKQMVRNLSSLLYFFLESERPTKSSIYACCDALKIKKTELDKYLFSISSESSEVFFTIFKIHKAMYLIRCGKSIKETASLMGYKSTAHFCRFFQKSTGVIASDYQQSYNNPFSLPL